MLLVPIPEPALRLGRLLLDLVPQSAAFGLAISLQSLAQKSLRNQYNTLRLVVFLIEKGDR